MNIVLDGLKISAISAAVPERILGFDELSQLFGEDEVRRISLSTGIQSVRVASSDIKTSDLCIAAANQLFSDLNIKQSSIDGVVFVSQTPDYRLPATSCILQHHLGFNKNTVAFDIAYGCSGYIYGLYQAALLIFSGSCKKVLVFAADTISQYLNPNDQKTRLVFGDAGTATLLEKGSDSLAFSMMTDGSGAKHLIIPKKGDRTDGYLSMDGAAVMEFALREVPGVIEQVIKMKKWQKDEVDAFILHQANVFMINYLRKKIRIPKEKVPIVVDGFGNTGPASIPLAICAGVNEAQREKVVFSGFGVGLSWGSVAGSLQEAAILPACTV